MSYTQLCKKWEKEYKLKLKQEKETRKIQKQKEEEFKFQIYLAKDKQEKQEQKEREEKQKRIISSKEEILKAIEKNNPFSYKQFIIIWDILTYNFDQILADLQRNKITITDIKLIIEYIESHSKELISDFWKEKLLTV